MIKSEVIFKKTNKFMGSNKLRRRYYEGDIKRLSQTVWVTNEKTQKEVLGNH